MYEICAKTSLEGTLNVHSKFSCVRSSHDLCERTHVHSLEGTLLTTPSVFKPGPTNQFSNQIDTSAYAQYITYICIHSELTINYIPGSLPLHNIHLVLTINYIPGPLPLLLH